MPLFVPWGLRASVADCLFHISNLQLYYYPHILEESKKIADWMADFGMNNFVFRRMLLIFILFLSCDSFPSFHEKLRQSEKKTILLTKNKLAGTKETLGG